MCLSVIDVYHSALSIGVYCVRMVSAIVRCTFLVAAVCFVRHVVLADPALCYGQFPKFHRVCLGRDPGTLKSDIV